LKKREFKLSTIIIFFVCIVVILSLLITDLLISRTINENIRGNLEEKAKIISRTVAHSTIVKKGLLDRERDAEIQDYSKDIQRASDVSFIVVMDMQGIRMSHPNPEQIGKPFIGGDEKKVLSGKESISVSEGTLGKSLRAFSPIFNEKGTQIGAVAVGISLNSIETALDQGHENILIGSIIGILVGIIGAFIMAKYIKKTLFGLEPITIAKILEERNTMLQSVHEGIIAVNKDSTIALVNKSAVKIFNKAGLPSNMIGKQVQDYLPQTRLERVLKLGEAELDDEQVINGVSILVNRVPLIVNDEVVGAISTFRDKTEVNLLAEQLTGVKTYADALRTQSHEFKNNLHVILGLVKMGNYTNLKEYIKDLVSHQEDEVTSVTKRIKDPVLAGFVMGKLSFAREANVEMTMECHTIIPEPEDTSITHDIITILGNFIDNAVDSMASSAEKELLVELSYQEELLEVIITDTGVGISREKLDDIFMKGYSSKGEKRGYGLYLVDQSIKKLGGSLHVESKINLGTTFRVEIPYRGKEKND
jgi:two-component system, CitB family, sensor histidine kinase MalK